jgi:hypothetical protein
LALFQGIVRIYYVRIYKNKEPEGGDDDSTIELVPVEPILQIMLVDSYPKQNMSWADHITRRFDFNIAKAVIVLKDDGSYEIECSRQEKRDLILGRCRYEIRNMCTFTNLLHRLHKYLVKKKFYLHKVSFHPSCNGWYKKYIVDHFQFLHTQNKVYDSMNPHMCQADGLDPKTGKRWEYSNKSPAVCQFVDMTMKYIDLVPILPPHYEDFKWSLQFRGYLIETLGRRHNRAFNLLELPADAIRRFADRRVNRAAIVCIQRWFRNSNVYSLFRKRTLARAENAKFIQEWWQRNVSVQTNRWYRRKKRSRYQAKLDKKKREREAERRTRRRISRF